MQEVTDILKQSIQYSLDHRKEAVDYALQFGRDLNAQLADQFVGMYVNHWTLDYGDRGRIHGHDPIPRPRVERRPAAGRVADLHQHHEHPRRRFDRHRPGRREPLPQVVRVVDDDRADPTIPATSIARSKVSRRNSPSTAMYSAATSVSGVAVVAAGPFNSRRPLR
jgi:hypothetical protein